MKVSSKLLAGGGVGDNDRSGLITINLNFKNNWYDKVFGSAFIYIMLVAGASAGNTSAWGGALPFDVVIPPSIAWWDFGSSCIYHSLLVRVLAPILPVAVLLCLL